MFNLNKIHTLIGSNKFFKFKLIVFLNSINFILELATILSIPAFISLLIDKNYLFEKYNIDLSIIFFSFDPVLACGVLIIFLFVIKNFFYTYLIYKQSNLIEKLKKNLSQKVLSEYLLGSYEQHLTKNPATITKDVTYSVQYFGSYLLHLINLFRELVSVVFIFLLLFYIKPLILITTTVFLFFVALIFQKVLKKNLKKRAEENQKLNDFFTKNVYNIFSSIKDIKILGKELNILKKFKFEISRYERNLFFFQVLEKIPKIILEVISIIFLVVLTLIFFYMTDDQKELFALLSIFLVATVRLIPSFSAISTSINYLKIFEPGLKSLYKERNIFKVDQFKQKKFKKNYTTFKNYNKNELIIVEKLSFGYNHKDTLLRNINLKIYKGKMNCIIGKTGSGKSTLINIMMGLIKPKKGDIFYLNNNIKNNIHEWYKSISFVSQDPYLIEDSILKNITFDFTNKKVDRRKLNNAIRNSALIDTIKSLPSGLNTKIRTMSNNLSGGEKQRIALARALYRNSKVLFLDEFTNAIDMKTESQIIKNLQKLKDKTFIIVSHKKSTISKCDKVWKISH